MAHGAASDPDVLLRQMDGAVRAAAADIRGMTPEQRGRKGVHNRRGELTVAEFVDILIVGHVEDHLTQIKQVLGAPG